MLTKCPSCAAGVIPKQDGTCPSCGKQIPHSSDSDSPKKEPVEVLVSPEEQPIRTREITEQVPRAATRMPGPDGQPKELLEFLSHLYQLTPYVVVTPAIFVINVLIYLVMVVSGVDWLTPQPQALTDWGGNRGMEVVDGEIWRLFTCMWLHAGIIHVSLNMFIFYQVGTLVERFLGNISFLIVYLLTGLFASIATLYWNVFENPVVVSVGASGALFGIFGTLLGLMLRSDQTVPKALSRELLRNLLVLLGYNLIFSYMIPEIDMAAHSGGLVAGFLFGLILRNPIRVEAGARRWIRTLIVTVISIPILTVAILWMPKGATHYFHLRQELFTMQDEVLPVQKKAEDQFRQNQITKERFARIVETKVLPPWRDLLEQFEAVETVPKSEQKRYELFFEYLKAYETLLEELVRDLRKDNIQAMRKNLLKNQERVREAVEALDTLQQ